MKLTDNVFEDFPDVSKQTPGSDFGGSSSTAREQLEKGEKIKYVECMATRILFSYTIVVLRIELEKIFVAVNY